MSPPRQKVRYSHRLAGGLIERYLRLVRSTSKIVYEPENREPYLGELAPAIVAVWHGQFLMTTSVRPRQFPLRLMVARHGDAEVFAQALARDDIALIRGAGAGGRQKDRGGAQALRGALKAFREGASVGMTADVPPGPARRAGEGIVTIARLSGRPIIPHAVASRHYVALKTWSRMTINLPFGRLAVVYGPPIHVPAQLDAEQLEHYRREVEDALNAVTRRAYQLAGSDPARATPLASETPSKVRAAPGFALGTYSWATRLAQPLAPLLLHYRERSGREDHARRGERMGFASSPRPDGTVVWIHAASVGETNAVLPLMERLRQARPDVHFLLTTGTVTSAALAAKRLHPQDIHQFVPLDAPGFVRRFLEHWHPDLAVFTESEIWPNLLAGCAAQKIRTVIVNARMSPRSYESWRRMPQLAASLFGGITAILAQNEDMAKRFCGLGAKDVRVVGNLKLDSPPPLVNEVSLDRLREALGGRPVFLAASTHAGEEAQVGQAHRQLVRAVPGILTIIAPRHPERGTAVAEDLKRLGLRVAQRSTGALPDERTDVYIADTIGELGTLYALAPVAFIGGSLVSKGGQNPIEAIRHQAVVLMGPHWFNFSDACQMLLTHGGMIEVCDADQLAEAVAGLLSDERRARSMGQGAEAALAQLSGALDESVAVILPLLPSGKELMRAS